MDDRRFDELTASLADGRSRRSVVRGAAAGGFAALLAAIGIGRAGVEEVDAKGCGKRCKKKKGNKKRQCLKRCRNRGGGGAGTPALGVSTNATGAGPGASCTQSNDCLIGLVCAGPAGSQTCQACVGAQCPGGGFCCTLGVCQVVNGGN